MELPVRQETSDEAEVAAEITQPLVDNAPFVADEIPEDVIRDSETSPEDVSRVPKEAPEDIPTHTDDEAVPETPAPVTFSLETPATSHAPSEADSTHPTTPSSATAPQAPNQSQKASVPAKISHRPAVPLIPAIPIIPNFPSRPSQRMSQSAASGASLLTDTKADVGQAVVVSETLDPVNAETSSTTSEQTFTATPPPVKAPPKSWADLVRTKASFTAIPTPSTNCATTSQPNGFAVSKAGFLSDVLSSFKVDSRDDDTKIAFLEPRGLVNTGNMCYMNAVSMLF